MEFPKVEYLEMLVGLILIAVVFGATYLKEIKDQTKAIRALLTTLTDHARDSRDTLWDLKTKLDDPHRLQDRIAGDLHDLGRVQEHIADTLERQLQEIVDRLDDLSFR